MEMRRKTPATVNVVGRILSLSEGMKNKSSTLKTDIFQVSDSLFPQSRKSSITEFIEGSIFRSRRAYGKMLNMVRPLVKEHRTSGDTQGDTLSSPSLPIRETNGTIYPMTGMTADKRIM